MSYQVLARKYRPANFQGLEGQEHVLQALVNALDNNRLHHAYLFTGTRGVGKTTIARILARCLNCEQGISSIPCGSCGSCVEIGEGRSIDLIEYDAASRTRVEDTREILDNVQYMPSRCRFKIYLIDEVHMLSNHSFNALLKTLEEPPQHIKFLLATTNPKKLPITVLSRCLQFNLKNISPEGIVAYLQKILPEENIEFEESALWKLGRAANGSMRDALSLTDQAINFGNNAIRDEEVRQMLGSIDQQAVFGLLHCLIEKDAAALLDGVNTLAQFSPDYGALLAETLGVLHRIAVAQAVPDAVDNSQGDQSQIMQLAGALSREEVQLYYQIGLIGQRDLPLAPDARTGLEMTLLRMLAFTPNADQTADTSPKKKVLSDTRPSPAPSSLKVAQSNVQTPPEIAASIDLAPETWARILPELGLPGVTQSVAANTVIVSATTDECEILLHETYGNLWNNIHQRRIEQALQARYGHKIVVRIQTGRPRMKTPAEIQAAKQQEVRDCAIGLIKDDSNIKQLIERFNGTLDMGSIRVRK